MGVCRSGLVPHIQHNQIREVLHFGCTVTHNLSTEAITVLRRMKVCYRYIPLKYMLASFSAVVVLAKETLVNYDQQSVSC